MPPSFYCMRELTLHGTAEGIQDSLRGKVLRGDQVDKVPLSFFFLISPRVRSAHQISPGDCFCLSAITEHVKSRGTYVFNDVEDGRIGFLEVSGKKLQVGQETTVSQKGASSVWGKISTRTCCCLSMAMEDWARRAVTGGVRARPRRAAREPLRSPGRDKTILTGRN